MRRDGARSHRARAAAPPLHCTLRTHGVHEVRCELARREPSTGSGSGAVSARGTLLPGPATAASKVTATSIRTAMLTALPHRGEPLAYEGSGTRARYAKFEMFATMLELLGLPAETAHADLFTASAGSRIALGDGTSVPRL